MQLPPANKNPIVIQVLSASFCGSSLLNLLLASQRDVIGLGEASHVYHPNHQKTVYCKLCCIPVEECPFYRDIDHQDFYRNCLRKGNAQAVVDTSKSMLLMTQVWQPECDHRIVLLSKTPHEFAASWTRHRSESVDQAFRTYINHYRTSLQQIQSSNRNLYPKTCLITYRQLATNTAQTIQMLCHWCGLEFDPLRLKYWYAPSSHVVGGNGAIAAQMDARPNFFTQDGKYKGRQRQIFLDDSWCNDSSFMNACQQAYQTHEKELSPILSQIGQPPLAQLLAQVRTSTPLPALT